MSSYQFVNSLTSCYGQSRGGPEGNSGPCDYYTPQAYNNCYGGVSSVASGPATGAPPYTAYLQHNGDHHNPHSHHTDRDTLSSGSSGSNVYQTVAGRMPHHQTGGGGGGGGGGGVMASVLGPSVVHHQQPKRSPTPSSCKYVSQPVDTASSPQDLSATSTSGPSHMSDRTSPVLASSRSGSATGAVAGSGSGSGGGPGGGGHNGGMSNNQTGSNSENGQANSSQFKGGNSNSNQNQPQIYPWMRKVHVGQSKLNNNNK